jgi:hypothetical protein
VAWRRLVMQRRIDGWTKFRHEVETSSRPMALSASPKRAEGACDARHKSAPDVRYSDSCQHNPENIA